MILLIVKMIVLSLHQKISQVEGTNYCCSSGNDAGNACKGSPNAAPLSVNFTNYGQCIDAFSPGLDITSASAHRLSSEIKDDGILMTILLKQKY